MSLLPESPAESPAKTGALLRRYVKGDASAFRDLVRRYYPLVLAAAMRRSEGRRALAEDAAQLVFIDLARRAPGLRADERLGGWLHQRAVRAASTLLRGETRRHARERRAAAEASVGAETTMGGGAGLGLETRFGSELNLDSESAAVYSLNENPWSQSEATSPAWQELAPHLDSALQRLSATDRDAVLLRCVDGRNFQDVGAALGLSDDAAQKRVSRALEKLRSILLKRRGTVPAISVLAAGLGADHARACGCASVLSGEPFRAAVAAMAKAGPITTWAARWLPQLKAAAAGSALACAAWAWPLIHGQRALERSLSLSGQTGTHSSHSPAAGEAAIRFPVFPALPKITEEATVEEIVRGIAALAAGPYNGLATDRFSVLLEQLKDGDRAAEALKRIAESFPPALQDVLDRRRWRGALLLTWAEKDPIAALDHTLSHVSQFDSKGSEPSDGLRDMLMEILREQRQNLSIPALSRWYATRMVADPRLQWGSRQKWLVLSIGKDIAAQAVEAHSEESLRTILTVENQRRIGLTENLTDQAKDTTSLELLARLAPALETPALRAKLMTAIVRKYGSVDPEAGRLMVESAADPEQRLSWAAELLNYDTSGSPEERDLRAEWWLSMASLEQREETAKLISQRGDPEWGCQWLERQLPPDAFRAFLREQFRNLACTPVRQENLPRLKFYAAQLRRLAPQDMAALFEEVDTAADRFFPNRAKIESLLKP